MKRSSRIGYWIVIGWGIVLMITIFFGIWLYNGQKIIEAILIFSLASVWYLLILWVSPLFPSKPSAREMRRMALLNRLAVVNALISHYWDGRLANLYPEDSIKKFEEEGRQSR